MRALIVHVFTCTTAPERPQSGRVPLGCQIERKISNDFVTKDGKLLLVMNKDHAAFQTAAGLSIPVTVASGQPGRSGAALRA